MVQHTENSVLESPVLLLPVLCPVFSLDQDAVIPVALIASLVLKYLVVLDIFELDNLYMLYKDELNIHCCVNSHSNANIMQEPLFAFSVPN